MIIRHLNLKNFRRFKNLSLPDLPEGLIGILGKNGAGKSSLLEAIGWALYGTYTLTDRTEKEGVKTQGTGEEEDCEVTLEFEMNGDAYRVIRRLHGRRALVQAWLYKNGEGEPVAEREEGVNTYVAKLFSMDRVTFFASVFARQREIDLLTSQKPAERQQIIRRLLGIDLIDLAIQQIRRDCRTKQEIAANLKAMMVDAKGIAKERDGLVNQRAEMLKEKEGHEQILKVSKEECDRLKVDKESMEAKRKTYETVRRDLLQIDQELKHMQELHQQHIAELSALEQEHTELLRLEPNEAEYKRVRRERENMETLRGLYLERKNIEKHLFDLREDIGSRTKERQQVLSELAKYASLQAMKQEAATRLRDVKTSHQQLLQECSTIAAKVEACHTSITQFAEKKSNVERLGPESKCPECFQDLGQNYEKILEHLQQEIEKQELILRNLEASRLDRTQKTKEAAAAVTALERRLEEIHEAEKQERELRGKIAEIERRLRQMEASVKGNTDRLNEIGPVEFSGKKYDELKVKEKTLSQIRDRIVQLRTKTGRMPLLKEALERLVKGTGATTDKKRDKQTELGKIGFNEEAFDSLIATYERTREKVHQQALIVQQTKHRVEQTNILIAQKEMEIVRQAELHEKWETIMAEIRQRVVLEELMGKFRQDLANRIRPMLAARASELLASTTDDMYSVLELDEEYNIYVYDRGERFPISRFSGGEKDLVNLCLRIAISQVISERSNRAAINFIALDEVFGSQDEERKENILQSLQGLSGQFRQIFLITHFEDLKDMMQHVLSVSAGPDGVSAATFG